MEHPSRPVACQADAKVCPDGTSVGRTEPSCTFPACPPPNVSLLDTGIAYAVPEDFVIIALPDSASVVAYEMSDPVSIEPLATIVIRRHAINASSTALATIQQTAIGGASGLPVPTTAYSSTVIGTKRFTVVNIERFEGVVDTAYYLARSTDVLRFDAIDREVMNWTDVSLDISRLPANTSLRELLATLQGG